MIMDFLGVCLDQLANHAAKLRYMTGGSPCPLVVRCRRARESNSELSIPNSSRRGCPHARPESRDAFDSGSKRRACYCRVFDDDPVVFIEPTLLYFGADKESGTGW